MRYAAYRTPPRGRRGSVILMTVGLLVIIGMLGVTFLVVAHMDARQTRALAAKAPADPVAGGIVQQLRQKLLEDLYIENTDGPYGAYTGSTNADKWAQFVDYPSDGIDRWLADSDVRKSLTPPEADGSWCTYRHISDLDEQATQNPVTVIFTRSNGTWNIFGNSVTPNFDVVDTDGDGWADAVLYDTNVTNAEGDKYYAAVRVIDLGGLICVNTAAEPNNPADPNKAAKPTAPVNIDLRSFLGGALYDTLHGARCNGADPDDLGLLATRAAGKLLQPDSPYLPFAIGDEMFLRWAQPLSAEPPTAAGRLFGAIGTIGDDARYYLTTFNCSRILVRRPGVNDAALQLVTNDPNQDDFLAQVVLDVSSDDSARQATYRQMFALLKKLGIGTGDDKRKIMAAHFVANLWAYQATTDGDWPWVFRPTGESFEVYGIIRQPVIAEAYAKHTPESLPGVGDNKWFAAVEIFNPYTVGVSIAGAQYKLAGQIIPGPGPGQRDVYYNYAGYANLSEVETDTGIPVADLSSWTRINDNGFRFYGGNTIKLTLEKGTTQVVIDEVSSDDIGHGATNPSDQTEISNARRDDQNAPDRARYNVASYVLSEGPSAKTSRSLGDANTLTVNPSLPEPASYPVPITTKGGAIADLGECLSIYLAGHYKDAVTQVPFTKSVSDKNISGIFDDVVGRGRLDFHPDNINFDQFPPNDYPDVPAAAFLGEFFTLVAPDDTRRNVDGEATRIYGRININTAPLEVLKQLPWPTTVGAQTINRDQLADYILAYRDMRQTSDGLRTYGPGPADRLGPGGANIANLRNISGSQVRGFLTAGELAIPLADYANKLLGWTNYTVENTTLTKYPAYLQARDSLYRAVSNLITVNSDVFAAYILVQLRDGLTEAVKHTWNYVAVLDRSNCRQTGQPGVPGDLPAVLLFSEVK